MFHCACAKRINFHFQSESWRHRRVPRPRFPVGRGNFGDSHTFNEVIGLLLISACILRTSSHKMGVGGKIGVRRVYPNELVSTFVFLRLCQFWWKSIKKCERKSACRLTQGQRQTGFIVCLMLYAIATGQITNHLWLRYLSCWFILTLPTSSSKVKVIGQVRGQRRKMLLKWSVRPRVRPFAGLKMENSNLRIAIRRLA